MQHSGAGTMRLERIRKLPNKIWQIIAFVAVAFILCPRVSTFAEGAGEARKPTKQDKCPVCGMFVYKYPDWLGQIHFTDGSVVFFDGAKDLFKYYLDLKQYKPGKKTSDIAAIHVTEYYDLKPIDARKAWYVMGSDVYGPMGHELIPFAVEEDAKAFKKDHIGKKIVRFEEVTPKLIGGLD
jgi:copper chaperone NosL